MDESVGCQTPEYCMQSRIVLMTLKIRIIKQYENECKNMYDLFCTMIVKINVTFSSLGRSRSIAHPDEKMHFFQFVS